MSDTESEAAAPAELQAELGELSATPRTRHHRLREQGRQDRADLLAVLAAGFVAHLGLPAADGVMVVPTVYGFTEA